MKRADLTVGMCVAAKTLASEPVRAVVLSLDGHRSKSFVGKDRLHLHGGTDVSLAIVGDDGALTPYVARLAAILGPWDYYVAKDRERKNKARARLDARNKHLAAIEMRMDAVRTYLASKGLLDGFACDPYREHITVDLDTMERLLGISS